MTNFHTRVDRLERETGNNVEAGRTTQTTVLLPANGRDDLPVGSWMLLQFGEEPVLIDAENMVPWSLGELSRDE